MLLPVCNPSISKLALSNGVSVALNWKAATDKANAFIAQLNLSEKAAMVTGNSSAGYCIGNSS